MSVGSSIHEHGKEEIQHLVLCLLNLYEKYQLLSNCYSSHRFPGSLSPYDATVKSSICMNLVHEKHNSQVFYQNMELMKAKMIFPFIEKRDITIAARTSPTRETFACTGPLIIDTMSTSALINITRYIRWQDLKKFNIQLTELTTLRLCRVTSTSVGYLKNFKNEPILNRKSYIPQRLLAMQ